MACRLEITFSQFDHTANLETNHNLKISCNSSIVLWLLGIPIPADFDGRPVVEAFTR